MAAGKASGKRYGAKASEKVEKAMHERKHGTLRSGSGQKVTSKKQAIAIGLSEAREAGGKVPKKAAAKKSATKKPVAKKSAPKKATPKAPRKRATTKRTTAKRRTPKRTSKR